MYIVKIMTSCSTGFGLLVGPWWDSVTEKYNKFTDLVNLDILIIRAHLRDWPQCVHNTQVSLYTFPIGSKNGMGRDFECI